MKKILVSLGVAALAAFVSAVPSAPQKYDVELSLKDKKVSGLSRQGLTLAFQIEMSNTLAAPLSLVRYDYRVVIEEAEFLNLRIDCDPPIPLESHGRLVIGLPVKITYEYLFQTAPAVRAKDQAACFVTAGLTFQDEKKKEKRVPLALIGDFPLYRGLEVKIQPIVARDLSVGGADLLFRASFRNPNGFSLRIGRLDYKLDLAGVNISGGTFALGAAVDAGAEKTYELPLLLDFFETGKAVRDGLEQPPMAVRFSGEAEIGTPWGDFKIPIDKSDKVAVVR